MARIISLLMRMLCLCLLCSVWQVHTAFSAVHLELKRLDLTQDAIPSIQANISLPYITDNNIKELCNMLGYLNADDMPRCTELVSRTARVRSIQPMVELLVGREEALCTQFDGSCLNMDAADIEAFSQFRIDALLFFLTYAYNNRQVDTQEETATALNVCVVGSFVVQIARLVAEYNPGYSLWVFSENPAPAELFAFSRFNTYMRWHGRSATLVSGQSFREYIMTLPEQQRQFCDILHFREASSPVNEAEVHELSVLALRPRPDLPAQVLWEVYFMTGRHNANVKLKYTPEGSLRNAPLFPKPGARERSVRWEATGKWTTVSLMSLTEPDLNGFAHWQHYFGSQDHNFILYTGILDRAIVKDERDNNELQCSADSVLDTVVFVTYTARVLEETSFGIRNALQAEGFLHVSVMGDFNVTEYRKHVSLAERLTAQCGHRIVALQVSVGSLELDMLTPFFVSVQTEQPWNTYFTMPAPSSIYLDTLRDALGIWVMSEEHKRFLVSDFGFSQSRISVVPMYSDPAPLPMHRTPGELLDGARDNNMWAGEDVDVTFFGFCCARRLELLKLIAPILHAQGITFKPLCSTVGNALWGHERELFIAQSKVVLNLHMWEKSSLEVHRVNHLLLRGKCVVSERSQLDPALDEEYESEGAVVFGSGAEELASLLVMLVRNTGMRRAVERSGHNRYMALVSRNTSPVWLAIESAVAVIHAA